MSIEQCVAVTQSTIYGWGIDHRLVTVDGVAPTCNFGVAFFNTAGCTGTLVNSETLATIFPTNAWTQTGESTDSAPTGVSARLRVECLGLGVNGAYAMRFDDGFLGAGLVPVELQSFEIN